MSSLTWNISYQKDRGFELHLNKTPAWVEAVSPILEKIGCFFLCWLPFYWSYRLGSAIYNWTIDWDAQQLVVPLTKEQAFMAQPGQWEFLFEDEDDDADV